MDEKPPAVTVVVSVYNKAWIVDKCVSSLLSIDYPHCELLIIDGYSTDGSYEILKKYEDRIRIVRVHGNYAVALNRILDIVATPLLALTDADCTVAAGWIRELVRGFDEGEDIVATAGYVGTGEDLSLLAVLTGIEYEGRYVHFPKYLSRAPTMNLCVRTGVARQVRFDERLQVAIDTDFGFRMSRRGKILYVPSAIVYHHPRTTWRGFFIQQVGFARGAFWVYLRHKDQLGGDSISTFSMIWQIPLFILGCLCLLLSPVSRFFVHASLACFAALFLIYLRDIIRLPLKARHYPVMLAMFLVRTTGWAAGGIRAFISCVSAPLRAAGREKLW